PFRRSRHDAKSTAAPVAPEGDRGQNPGFEVARTPRQLRARFGRCGRYGVRGLVAANAVPLWPLLAVGDRGGLLAVALGSLLGGAVAPAVLLVSVCPCG